MPSDAQENSEREELWSQWCRRPVHLKHLSFDEWLQDRGGGVGSKPVAATVVTEPKLSLPGRERHEAGRMNKLEGRYAQHLELRRTAGEIRYYLFEAVKLRLAAATFWTPDFVVAMPDGAAYPIELHEVKGHWEDDARVKIKVAAREFASLFRVVAVRWDKGAKDWKFEEFKA